MNTRAPELSALITILRSVGPVISTRRSCRSGGASATRHVILAHVTRLLEEDRHLPGQQPLLAGGPGPEQLLTPRAERTLQLGDELERLRGEDPLVAVTADLDAVRELSLHPL